MGNEVLRPEDYIATYCRTDRHQERQTHPVVPCACPSHFLVRIALLPAKTWPPLVGEDDSG